ncbi:hypothetical protein FO478_03895 [Heyndrickxia coagulans DSM 1 = ATCC 7050]|nr:hypothetical protein [Heyndrickxia coagulans DSM 1 = ATCC 7050]
MAGIERQNIGPENGKLFSSPDEGQNTRLGSGELFFIGTMKTKHRAEKRQTFLHRGDERQNTSR